MGSVISNANGGNSAKYGAAGELCFPHNFSHRQLESSFEWCCFADDTDHRDHDSTSSISKAKAGRQCRFKRVTMADDPNEGLHTKSPSCLGDLNTFPSQQSQNQDWRFTFEDRPNWTSAEQHRLVERIVFVAKTRESKLPGLKDMQKLRAAKILGQETNMDDNRFWRFKTFFEIPFLSCDRRRSDDLLFCLNDRLFPSIVQVLEVCG
jgi:hypothetical protein